MKASWKSLIAAVIWTLSLACAAASMTSCGKKGDPTASQGTVEETPQATDRETEDQAPSAEEKTAEDQPPPTAAQALPAAAQSSTDQPPPADTYSETVTLMLYMTGSDLESGAAAATKDLEEIAQSGVDLDRVNLLVLTGGARKWHSTNPVIPTDANVIYRLTKDGYEEAKRFEPLSMGDPQNLARFLTFCAETFPADSYDLILWDHGNGPVIGYGSDKQYGGDGLTLPEIREALQASPFDADNKLSVVGMDACLMSSAELMCILGDYADYLVASQETEPHFGWNYDFLRQCGHIPQEDLVREIVREYSDFCKTYFSSNPFFAGDVTLAAIDLSRSGELQKAVNALFARAAADVSGDFNKLAISRIRTHGFGRASTGSEYDLVDLAGLMGQMQERYPRETQAVRGIIAQAVLASESTVPESCGISLYYPYFNKSYYRKSWKAAYSEIGVFPSYELFLRRYEQVWLGTDLKDLFEGELVPAKGSDGSTFTMQLSGEQAEQYAYARYYILRRKGKGVYTPVYMSTDVTEKKGTLTARFDGKVIYCSDNYGRKVIPTTRMWDSPGDVTDYTLYGTARRTENGQDVRQACEIQIAVDKREVAEGELRVKGIFPSGSTSGSTGTSGTASGTTEELGTGKREPIDPADWTLFSFVEQRQRYLTRDSEDRILPFYDWPEGDWTVWSEMPVANGLHFTYEPLYDDGNDYFILFEVADVQDNRYASELLPITLAKAPARAATAQVHEVLWEKGSSATLWEEQGVRAELALEESRALGTPMWRLILHNENDFPVRTGIGPIQMDGKLYVGNETLYLEAEAGKEASMVLTQIENTCRFAGITKPGRITFSMMLERKDTREYLFTSTPFAVTVGEGAGPEISCGPTLDASASGQVLMEKDGIRAELEGMGNYSGYKTASDLTIRFRITNDGDTDRTIHVLGTEVDGVYFHEGRSRVLKPGQTWYTGVRLYTSNLKKLDCSYSFYPREEKLTSIGSLALLLGIESEPVRCPVALDTKGEQEDISPEGTIVYEDDGFVLYQESTHVETRSSDRRKVLVRELWGVNKSGHMRTVTLKEAGTTENTSMFVYSFAPGSRAFLQAASVLGEGTGQNPEELQVLLTFSEYFTYQKEQSDPFVLLSAAMPVFRAQAAERGETEAPEFFTVFNEGGISIRLYDVLDFESGDRKVFFRVRNAGEKEATLSMSGFRIGEDIYMENSGYLKVMTGEEKDYQPLFLSYALTEASRDAVPVTSFGMDLKITGTDYKDVLYEGSCGAEIPAAYEPRMVCETAFGMRAQEQVLREDGKVRITLLSLGRYAGAADAHPVQGLLKVENMSGARIPAYVHALRLNGITVNIEKSAGGSLPSGRALYTPILVPKREIQRNEITEISETAVQVMTSENENTASGNAHAGGTWYPISLTESGDPAAGTGAHPGDSAAQSQEGEILYEDEEVQVIFLGTDPVWYPLSGKTELAWIFTYINKSSRDLEIHFSDFVVDGQKAAPGNEADKYVMSAVVGAGSRRSFRMMHFVEGEQPMPEISFRIRIQSPGSGELYRYPEEVFTVPGDGSGDHTEIFAKKNVIEEPPPCH